MVAEIDQSVAPHGRSDTSAAVDAIAARLGKGFLFPISYSVPSQLIVTDVPEKKFMAAGSAGRVTTGRAGGHSRYRFGPGEQDAYYQNYRDSRFAETTSKGGWDCLRHLEIMMNGSVPIFAKLESCPEYTMTHYPKALMLELRERYIGPFRDPVGGSFNAQQYAQDARTLLAHMRNTLTTVAMARYFLKCLDVSENASILFLTRDNKPDYLCETLLHGLRSTLGEQVVDVNKRWWLYDSAQPDDVGKLYGNGFTYTRHLRDQFIDRQKVKARIKNREFDLVVFGNIERGTPLLHVVQKYYPRQQIALLDGGDYPHFPGQPGRPATRRPLRDKLLVSDRDLSRAGVIFKREITEETLMNFAARS